MKEPEDFRKKFVRGLTIFLSLFLLVLVGIHFGIYYFTEIVLINIIFHNSDVARSQKIAVVFLLDIVVYFIVSVVAGMFTLKKLNSPEIMLAKMGLYGKVMFIILILQDIINARKRHEIDDQTLVNAVEYVIKLEMNQNLNLLDKDKK